MGRPRSGEISDEGAVRRGLTDLLFGGWAALGVAEVIGRVMIYALAVGIVAAIAVLVATDRWSSGATTEQVSLTPVDLDPTDGVDPVAEGRRPDGEAWHGTFVYDAGGSRWIDTMSADALPDALSLCVDPDDPSRWAGAPGPDCASRASTGGVQGTAERCTVERPGCGPLAVEDGDLSYDEARRVVVDELAPSFGPGTFCIDDRWITETEDAYLLTVESRELLRSEDDPSAPRPETDVALAGVQARVTKDGGELTTDRPLARSAGDPGVARNVNPAPAYPDCPTSP